jgi:hypothetical protein
MNAVLSMGALLKDTKEQYEPGGSAGGPQRRVDRDTKLLIIKIETPGRQTLLVRKNLNLLKCQ